MGVESTSDEGDISDAAQQVIAELKEVPFFSGLGSKSLIKLIPALQQQSFAKGATIMKQGDEGNSFYIIRTGNVQVMLDRSSGPSIAVAQLSTGEGFGEMALLNDQRRIASIVATTDVNVWWLPKEAFQALLGENLSLALYFNRVLIQRLSSLQAKIIP